MVTQRLERVSREVLGRFQDFVREYVRGCDGIYALYRGPKLYYVGLATDLRSRLKAHLKDRHTESWDRFSLYLTSTDDHLRELEALLIRISSPTGNRATMRLRHAVDLGRTFRHEIRKQQQKEMEEFFPKRFALRASPERSNGRRRKGHTASDGAAPLSGYFRRNTSLRMTYKGKLYKATVRKDGTVKFRGRIFNSPSLAAKHVAGHARNGWYVWKFEESPGEWVRLRELRRRGRKLKNSPR